jgi:hypothetical protein
MALATSNTDENLLSARDRGRMSEGAIDLTAEEAEPVHNERLAAVDAEMAQASGTLAVWAAPKPPQQWRTPDRADSWALLPTAAPVPQTPAAPHPPPLAQVEAQIEALLARQARLRAERDALQRAAAVDRRAPRRDWAATAFPWDAEVGTPAYAAM